MDIHLSIEQAEALSSTLRYHCGRLSRMANGKAADEGKREWAASRVALFSEIIEQIDAIDPHYVLRDGVRYGLFGSLEDAGRFIDETQEEGTWSIE